MKSQSPDPTRTFVLSVLAALLCLLPALPAANVPQASAAPVPAAAPAQEASPNPDTPAAHPATEPAAPRNQTDPTPPKNEMLDQSAWEAWQALPLEYKRKVDPRILAELQGEVTPAHVGSTESPADPASVPPAPRQPRAETRFIVHLRSSADLDTLLQTRVFASAVEQRAAVFNALVSESQSSQAALVAALQEQRAAGDVSTYQSFFIVNALAVDGGLATLVDLARRFDVVRIAANYPLVPLWDEQASVAMIGPPAAADVASSAVAQQENGIEWNIDLVEADRVWTNLGVTGVGAVVAGFDTGVDYTHPALVNSYRGNRGGSFDHNYNWFEPDTNLYPNGNLGRSVSNEPSDCYSHGTHTMGTMVGSSPPDAPVQHQVGMAPNARWIAVPGICYNTMPGNFGDDIGGIKAFQWLLCPTDLSGDLSTADCAKAPHAVNNSWGSANPVDDTFRPAIQALRAAGVAVVFSAGNPGAGEGSISAPANIPEAITVGATDIADEVAYFSARGPSFYEGEQKPELSAPGVDVNSTVPGGYYAYNSGTSMAAPHVTGLVGLMVAADLQDGVRDFDVDELERFMIATAVDLGEPGPDNDYGYGRINAYEAVRAVLTAGDLRGQVLDANTGEPVAAPLVTSVGLDSDSRFTARSISPEFASTVATGAYSLTVPAGRYNITVNAWGYRSDTFPGQVVFPDTLSVADFALSPLPRHTVSGYVRTGEAAGGGFDGLPASGAPVEGATVRVLDSPTARATSRADGFYSLDLPVGTHTLRIEAAQHRVITETVTVDAADISLDLSPPAAPSILLVDGSAFEGWFYGWPIYPIFEFALDQSGYLHELWRIEDPTVTDTAEENGHVIHGVPSFGTLRAYDVVIWMQSACGYCYDGAPHLLGADPALIEYLNSGGRLLLSGQDIGFLADGTSTLYDEYLQADLVSSYAADEGDTVNGRGFLADLELEITNATLYGYANGAGSLSPDSVAPSGELRNSFPVLTYNNSQEAAALAVDPCVGTYRALYFPVGYENLGPRADNRDPAFAQVMARSLQWLGGQRDERGLDLLVNEFNQTTAPGGQAFHHVELLNNGLAPLDIALAVEEAGWTTRVYSGTISAAGGVDPALELTGHSLDLAPCRARTVTVVVEVPEEAANGAAETVHFSATGKGSGGTPETIVAETDLQTLAFDSWRVRAPMNTARQRLGVAAQYDDIYLHAVGGFETIYTSTGYYYTEPSSAHERYNACTDTWEPLAPMPDARSNVATVMLDDKIYVIGGFGTTYYNVSTTLVYDRLTDSWSEAAGLPVALAGVGAAVANGKIYVFGGAGDFGEYVDTTYMYDPATGVWTERAPMPAGGRAYLAAATLNGKIYVTNGWPNLTRVEVYDPASDTWSEGPNTHIGRTAPSLAVAPDGYLYLAGGSTEWEDIKRAERYSPESNTWELISALNSSEHSGDGAAFVAGQMFVVGGTSTDRSTESLALETSFCRSNKTVDNSFTNPGGRLGYAVSLFAEPTRDVTVRLRDDLPANTLFDGFIHNPLGAIYDATTHQIRWNGTLAAGSAPTNYIYSVQLNNEGWSDGTVVTSTVTFRGALTSAPALRFDRATTSRVFEADFSRSYIEADRNTAIRAQQLRYTVGLESRTAGGGAIQFRDPLPAGLTYVPNSLQSPNGTGSYDPETRSIRWSGQVTAGRGGVLNDTAEYAWIDSDGAQSLSGANTAPAFAWQDIQESGTFITSGDDQVICDLPIGFAFPFYDTEETTFCVSTNGFISFDAPFSAFLSSGCLPNPALLQATVAGFYTDLVVYGGVHYQTFGKSPNRMLVIQWTDAPYYFSFSGEPNTFQIVLHENGLIDVQLLEIDLFTGSDVVIGVADRSGTQGKSYHCGYTDVLHEELTARFIPPDFLLSGAQTAVSFDVTVDADTPVNSEIVNTVYITGTRGSYQRSVTTLLNTLNLAPSRIDVPQQQIVAGEPMTLQFVVRNSGEFTATNASLTHLPGDDLSYVADSVTCGRGDCAYQDGQITWRGTVPPGGQTTVRYQAIPNAQLPDNSSLTATGQVADGHGSTYTLRKSFVTRSSDLAASTARVLPPFVEPGTSSTYELFVHNVGAVDTTSTLALSLPPGLTYVENSLICGAGTCTVDGSTIRWNGSVAARSVVPIRFTVRVPTDVDYGERYVFEATLTDDNRSESLVYGGDLTVAHNHHLAILFIPSQGITLYMPLIAQENGVFATGVSAFERQRREHRLIDPSRGQ